MCLRAKSPNILVLWKKTLCVTILFYLHGVQVVAFLSQPQIGDFPTKESSLPTFCKHFGGDPLTNSFNILSTVDNNNSNSLPARCLSRGQVSWLAGPTGRLQVVTTDYHLWGAPSGNQGCIFNSNIASNNNIKSTTAPSLSVSFKAQQEFHSLASV